MTFFLQKDPDHNVIGYSNIGLSEPLYWSMHSGFYKKNESLILLE